MMRELGLKSWQDVVGVLRDIIWIEDIYGEGVMELGREVIGNGTGSGNGNGAGVEV